MLPLMYGGRYLILTAMLFVLGLRLYGELILAASLALLGVVMTIALLHGDSADRHLEPVVLAPTSITTFCQ